MMTSFRIGQIVPSSNTTMETGIPAMLAARQAIRPERFTVHSSRMRTMNLDGVDALVLSACVQMPSLPVIAKVEAMTGKPVVTAAVATTFSILKTLGLEAIAPGGGALLAGAY